MGLATSAEPNQGLLVIRDVSKSYRVNAEPLPVLRNIALALKPGEFVSFVGASGCGKSTLLRLVIGLDTDYEGDILLDGKRIEGPGSERSIAFQDHRLFPWLTVEANIALGLDASSVPAAERRERIKDYIALVGLAGFETAYPHQLSGGMAQRAAIARALVNHPTILLLDEPFGALDSLTRARMQEEMLRIWLQQQVTVLMVTHDVEEAAYLSNKIVVMEPRPGRIRKIVPVALQHPRRRSSAEFTSVKEEVLEALGAAP